MAKQAIEPGFCQCGCGGRTKIAKESDPKRGWMKGRPLRFLRGHSARKKFLPFKQAREFVRSLGLKSQAEWDVYCRSGNRPHDIPATPEQSYKKDACRAMSQP
jgi:hypothetical protein